MQFLESIYNGGSGGGGGGSDVSLRLANIMPTTGIKVVDANGWIGGDYMNPYYPNNQYYNNFAIVIDGANFKNAGLGKVTFVDTSTTIGGRVYPTVTINGVTWLAENLDYKFSGLGIGGSTSNRSVPWAWYYDNNESLWGYDGRKCGLLYNFYAVKLLFEQKDELIPGWHLATIDECTNLYNYIGQTRGKRLMSNPIDWAPDWLIGTDDFGFNFLPAGEKATEFRNVGILASFWGASGPSDFDGISCNENGFLSLMSTTSFNYPSAPIRLVKDL
jgi:uncharacterized protein (TIGR02145 family)